MYNYHLYSVLKQRAFWCVVKQHMKICGKSEDIDLYTLSVLKQHTCFYSAPATQHSVDRDLVSALGSRTVIYYGRIKCVKFAS